MKRNLYNIRFPACEAHRANQHEAYFYFREKGEELKLRFHDYKEIFKRPGLYEQLFYDRLRCCSPEKLKKVLSQVLKNNAVDMNELRVLDLGAGNGMMGEILPAARIVGIDIYKEAYQACERDRPGSYDAYYVADLCNLDPALKQEALSWQFDCLTCIAALGFGDIPTKAFSTAFNLIQSKGWVAFNIRDTFLQETDTSGFSRLVKHLLVSDLLEIHHLERYRHRISIDGRPLFYYMIVGQKIRGLPDEIISQAS